MFPAGEILDVEYWTWNLITISENVNKKSFLSLILIKIFGKIKSFVNDERHRGKTRSLIRVSAEISFPAESSNRRFSNGLTMDAHDRTQA